MNVQHLIVLLVVGLGHQLTAADEVDRIQTGRYTNYTITPKDSLVDPLQVVIEVEIPAKMVFIGEAIEYLLQRSGYQIPQNSNISPPEMYVLFSRKIPLHQKNMGTIRLIKALDVLAGEAYEVQINRITREITFKLKNEYIESINGLNVQEFQQQWDNRLLIRPASTFEVDEPARLAASGIALGKVNGNSSKGANYGPVAQGETLSAIAKMFVSSKANESMVMVSIFDNNPEAFINGNMNALKAGIVLKIPSRESMDSMSKAQSEATTTAHLAAFMEDRVNE